MSEREHDIVSDEGEGDDFSDVEAALEAALGEAEEPREEEADGDQGAELPGASEEPADQPLEQTAAPGAHVEGSSLGLEQAESFPTLDLSQMTRDQRSKLNTYAGGGCAYGDLYLGRLRHARGIEAVRVDLSTWRCIA